MKSNLFFAGFLFINSLYIAQNKNPYIVLLNKDTIYCEKIEHNTSSNGRLTYLNYTTLDGKNIEYKSRFKIPKLDCFYYKRQTYEMIPRKLYKKNKRNIVSKRLVDGKITYCYFNNERFVNTTTDIHGMGGSTTTGFKLRYVRFKDEPYIQLTKKSMKRKIKPILQACQEFKQEYKGDYKINFMGIGITDMFNLYNKSCP